MGLQQRPDERAAAVHQDVAAIVLLEAYDRLGDVALPWDLTVSRVHAELVAVGDVWTVADDGLSRNGVFVNGERLVSRRRLRDGDALRISPEEGRIRAGIGAGELVEREPRWFPLRAGAGYAARYARTALPGLEGSGFG